MIQNKGAYTGIGRGAGGRFFEGGRVVKNVDF